MKYWGLIAAIMLGLPAFALEQTLPGAEWKTRSPQEVELEQATLDKVAEYLGGRGFIARHGYQVYTWGNYKKRGDVASACKPLFSHFLFKALEDKRIPNLDQPVVELEPRLNDINADKGYPDRKITWRHMANQISCYGLVEAPGTAFAYNDWQMALFWDSLFKGVYKAEFENVDETVFHPMLTDLIQCQDNPSMMAFGSGNRPGRVSISPRDFARFGLLYQHDGAWGEKRLLDAALAKQAITSPLPADLPRAGKQAADMIAGQRSLGSERIPDNQCDHVGSYSWLWWINGVNAKSERRWPDAPHDVFSALGHRNGMRGMAVLPGLDIVISWNDSRIGDMPEEPHPLNEAFRLLTSAVITPSKKEQSMSNPPDSVRVAMAQIFCLDGDREGNFVRIENAIQEAKASNAEIICFPETAILGWVNSDAHERAFPIPGDDSNRLCQLAKHYSIYICIGLAEKNGADLHDSAILIDDQGSILLKHRKMNILSELMTPSYQPGTDIKVVDTKFGRIGLLICADSFIEENLQRMAKLKPNLVLVPYGWAAPEDKWPRHGEELEKTVSRAALTIGAPLVGTDLVGAISKGPWTGWIYGGQSVASDAEGNIITTAKDRERDIHVVEIQLN
ncbi:MAG: carbon-nitrogen hydrolase family protein [Candidatus Hinthialibacter antarcticus]|nr:carbon-nitrogen hydrolase family protein [Candidatus Hinthialibacter antarcticus]